VAFALAAAGPGAWSLDHAFGLDWGAGWGFVALAAGILGGMGALIQARGAAREPLAAPPAAPAQPAGEPRFSRDPAREPVEPLERR